MPFSECPQLRPFLAAARDEKDPRFMVVWDQLGVSGGPQRLTLIEFHCLQLFDGRRSLRDIQAEAMRLAGGELLSLEGFVALVRRMDEALFLDGPPFRDRLAGPVREPSCVDSYGADPDEVRRLVGRQFTGPDGPGRPREPRPDGRFCGALIPHIDYHRGGATYAWGFKEVFEQTDAALFVIVGTSHLGARNFALTRKDFKTPLGTVPTDQVFIDRLVAHYGDGLFEDEIVHLPEWSIELEVVFLQYLYEKRRPFRVVPLLVGSFQDTVETGEAPSKRSDVARMAEALQRATAETKEPVCTIISGDLAHIGPKFGDTEPVRAAVLSASRAQDQALLKQAESADLAGYFRVIADEGDRRRICGFPPTYVALEALRPARGQVLRYDQYVHPRGHESVSFASVAFYR
jgi:AmmeMemoRadiSam system protein B